MLLLQPALSHLAFGPTVPSTTRPGGYHPALTRVRVPSSQPTAAMISR